MVRLNCKCSGRLNGLASFQQHLYIAIITHQPISSFRLDSTINIRWPNYSTSTLMYYLYEKLPIDRIGHANTIGVFLAVMIAIVSFVQFKDPRKRRRILKKETAMQLHKETHNSFHCYFNYYLALLTVLFIFPFYSILTGPSNQPDTIVIHHNVP